MSPLVVNEEGDVVGGWRGRASDDPTREEIEDAFGCGAHVCDCNNNQKFWKEITCLLISLVCQIERYKLREKHTTSELRKAGKQVLGVDKKS